MSLNIALFYLYGLCFDADLMDFLDILKIKLKIKEKFNRISVVEVLILFM